MRMMMQLLLTCAIFSRHLCKPWGQLVKFRLINNSQRMFTIPFIKRRPPKRAGHDGATWNLGTRESGNLRCRNDDLVYLTRNLEGELRVNSTECEPLVKSYHIWLCFCKSNDVVVITYVFFFCLQSRCWRYAVCTFSSGTDYTQTKKIPMDSTW